MLILSGSLKLERSLISSTAPRVFLGLFLATICHTDAAVDPGGVVVLLCHAGITGEAVVRSHWFLCLRTEQGITTLVVAVCVNKNVL